MADRSQTRRKTAILISGRGSNMASLIKASREPAYPAEISLVISNNADAAGLETAQRAGIATAVIDHSAYENRKSFEAALTAAIEESASEFVCLAGFMRILTGNFVNHWHNRLINIHPSLLPAFPGLNTHERALAAGVKIAGCSVHFVRAEVDTGPIIAQAAIPVKGNDTAETLAKRVLQAEHVIYPRALALLASGRARAAGEKVVLDDEESTDMTLFSPS